MKSNGSISKSDRMDNRADISNRKVAVPKAKLLSGSVVNKYPVVLDDGRTTIFISDRSKEPEARKNYEMRAGNKLRQYAKKS